MTLQLQCLSLETIPWLPQGGVTLSISLGPNPWPNSGKGAQRTWRGGLKARQRAFYEEKEGENRGRFILSETLEL